jgi:hypothetical protein
MSSILSLGREKSEKEKGEARLPRTAIPPAPPPIPHQQPQHRIYDPAALNFAQRLIDDQAEIERLKVDVDQWRARALAAEQHAARLEAQGNQDRQTFDNHLQKMVDAHDREIAKLSASRQNDVDRLTEERDFFKLKFARTVERLHVAGKVILDALSVDAKVSRFEGNAEPAVEPKVDMTAIAAELEQEALVLAPPEPKFAADEYGPRGQLGDEIPLPKESK